MMKTLLSLGHGYTARALALHLGPDDWTVTGTSRSPNHAGDIAALGATPVIWPGGHRSSLAPLIERASHLLISIAPGLAGCPVLAAHAAELAEAGHLRWVGYLSTTGVYGHHHGAWVDEDTPLTPGTQRGRDRVLAERQWQEVAAKAGFPLHIFRLAGIYGPGRGPFEKVKNGTARRIVKPDQVFSRIHVDDIAQVLAASIAQPRDGAIYNVCDDDPAPPQDVIGHAAELLGLPLPPEVSLEEAALGPLGRSFYGENKRVRNDRMKRDLGVSLRYPTYREGLAAIKATLAG